VLQLIQSLGYCPKARSLTKNSVAAFYKANRVKLNCANDVGAIADRMLMLYKPAPGPNGTRTHAWVSNKRNMAYRGRGTMMQVRTIAHRFKTTEEVDAIARASMERTKGKAPQPDERTETPTLELADDRFDEDGNTEDEDSDEEDAHHGAASASDEEQDERRDDDNDDDDEEEEYEEEYEEDRDEFEFNEDD